MRKAGWFRQEVPVPPFPVRARKSVLMKRPRRFAIVYVVALTAVMVGGPATGQDKAPPPAKAAPKADAAAKAPKSPYRKLAPGVLQDVDPGRQPRIVRRARHRRAARGRQRFRLGQGRYLPPRRLVVGVQVQAGANDPVDEPQPGGKMQRKLIWYMVYSVTNLGKTMHPAVQPDGTYKVEFVDEPIRFIPVFSLEAHRRLDETRRKT